MASLTNAERAFFGQSFLDDVDELVGFWETAQRELERAVSDPALAALIAAGPENLSAIDQRRRELIRQVDAELAILRERTRLWVDPALTPQVAAGAQAASAAVLAQGGADLVVGAGGALGLANTQTLRVLAEEILADTEFATASARRVAGRTLRATQQTLVTEAALNTSLLVSEARLENANQRARRIRRLLEDKADGGQFVNVNGRFFTLASYADIVARTRLAEAAVEGAFNATLAMGIDTVRVSDHGRTDRFCDPFAGKVFSISGSDSRFPRLEQRPPFHPRCRHALLPFVPALRTERELEFAIARSAGRIEPGVGIEEFFRAAS